MCIPLLPGSKHDAQAFKMQVVSVRRQCTKSDVQLDPADKRAGLRLLVHTCDSRCDPREGWKGLVLPPNVRAKRASTVGRQARAGENVQRTTSPGLVARRWGSA